MHTKNSLGCQVSLLNDEPVSCSRESWNDRQVIHQVARTNSHLSQNSSPDTPALFRSDSYDSHMTLDPASPLTPSLAEFGRHNSFPNTYPNSTHFHQNPYASYAIKTKSSANTSAMIDLPDIPDRRPSSTFGDDRSSLDRTLSGKRYPCRYRDSHSCDKTFTTSGHASRHSKIHTAEKCVQCSFQGCQKKFTRADNMKQHLETHFKDRTRSLSSSHKASSSTSGKAAFSAGVSKSGRSSRPPSRTSRKDSNNAETPTDSSHLIDPTGSVASSASATSNRESLDMSGFQRVLATGLDALVNAVEFTSRN